MRLFAVAVALAGLGCAGGSDLHGSLGSAYRLNYVSVRSRLYSAELSIEYVNAQEAVPVRVTLRLDAADPVSGGDYVLPDDGDITGRQVDGTEIPELLSGGLSLSKFRAEEGAEVAGEFRGEFDGGRDTLGLSGAFSTDLKIIDWPPAPEDAE